MQRNKRYKVLGLFIPPALFVGIQIESGSHDRVPDGTIDQIQNAPLIAPYKDSNVCASLPVILARSSSSDNAFS